MIRRMLASRFSRREGVILLGSHFLPKRPIYSSGVEAPEAEEITCKMAWSMCHNHGNLDRSRLYLFVRQASPTPRKRLTISLVRSLVFLGSPWCFSIKSPCSVSVASIYLSRERICRMVLPLIWIESTRDTDQIYVHGSGKRLVSSEKQTHNAAVENFII